MTPGRRAAAAILRAVSRGRRLDRAMADAAPALPERERRWVHEATYGTLRLRGRLDHLLGLHLRKGLSSLSPLLLDLLRQGAYQLLYMQGVPAYAAVAQTVEQVREVAGESGARLANGVLRSLEREGGDISRFPGIADDPLGYLSTWGSHPRWMVERWLERWKPEEVRRIVDSNNAPPPLYVRPVGLGPDRAETLLGDAGWRFRKVGGEAPCFEIENGINPAEVLDVVPGLIQDPGAALVTVYADPRPGFTVADLCAAPGGKALAMAGEGLYVLAADRSGARLGVLKENLARLEGPLSSVGGRVELVRADAQAPPLRNVPFLLLDVPCSGTGTLRRHPDARWRLSPRQVAGMATLQRGIMEAGAALVLPGGHLVYCTCTLETEENEGQVKGFLERHPEFRLDPTETGASAHVDEEGFLRVLPQSTGFDGAFAARMVRWG